jgi:uncharacterized protein YbbC (DUF1343 family)
VSFDKRPTQLNLSWLALMYSNYPNKEKFFSSPGFFDKLAGNTLLRKQITQGISEGEIRATWQKDLDNYKTIRKKYILYTDFE